MGNTNTNTNANTRDNGLRAETISVCADCHIFICNGDLLDYGLSDAESAEREREIVTGCEQYPGTLHGGDSDNDDEFSASRCDCCGTALAGSRHEVVHLRHAPVSLDVGIDGLRLFDRVTAALSDYAKGGTYDPATALWTMTRLTEARCALWRGYASDADSEFAILALRQARRLERDGHARFAVVAGEQRRMLELGSYLQHKRRDAGLAPIQELDGSES